MPPKAKASSNAKEADLKNKAPELPAPTTVAERTRYRFYQSNPVAKRCEDAGGIHALAPAERQTYINASLVRRVASRDFVLNNKAEREFWKQASKESLPARRISKHQRDHNWGVDKLGRDIGALSLDKFEERTLKQASLAAFEALHRRFLQKRELAAKGYTRRDGTKYEVTDDEIEEEKLRRKEMATLKSELYGETMGPYATNPSWDDVVPIPVNDPEGALAAIAYPEDYAEGVLPPA